MPKNTADQAIFKNNWTIKIIIAFRFCPDASAGLPQTIKRAIAISKKSVVQAGANSQFGGLNGGLFNPAYQPGMAGLVNMLPINPADKVTIMLSNNFHILFIIPPHPAFIISILADKIILEIWGRSPVF